MLYLVNISSNDGRINNRQRSIAKKLRARSYRCKFSILETELGIVTPGVVTTHRAGMWFCRYSPRGFN
ncbi:MAG TPA: hypothetical protein VIE89_01825, partial [Candidatus Binatia bacterium]